MENARSGSRYSGCAWSLGFINLLKRLLSVVIITALTFVVVDTDDDGFCVVFVRCLLFSAVVSGFLGGDVVETITVLVRDEDDDDGNSNGAFVLVGE